MFYQESVTVMMLQYVCSWCMHHCHLTVQHSKHHWSVILWMCNVM